MKSIDWHSVRFSAQLNDRNETIKRLRDDLKEAHELPVDLSPESSVFCALLGFLQFASIDLCFSNADHDETTQLLADKTKALEASKFVLPYYRTVLPLGHPS